MSPTHLVFEKDRPIESTILIGKDLKYRITNSEGLLGTKVKIIDVAMDNTIVTFEWREFGSDVIKFQGVKSLKLKNWLREGHTEDGRSANCFTTPIGDLVWQLDPTHRWKLYRDGNPERTLGYMKQKTSQTPLELIIEDEVLNQIDGILASWIILEHNLRMEEKIVKKAPGVAQEASIPF